MHTLTSRSGMIFSGSLCRYQLPTQMFITECGRSAMIDPSSQLGKSSLFTNVMDATLATVITSFAQNLSRLLHCFQLCRLSSDCIDSCSP